MSTIKKDYKFDEFMNMLENDLKTLKDEILELFTEEDEFAEVRLRNDYNVVFILQFIKTEEGLLKVSVDRVKHASVAVRKVDGEFNFDKNFIKPLKECEIDARIRVMDEEESENSW